MATLKIIPMANRPQSANVPELPTFNTREHARSFASRMREHGVKPTTPEKRGERWHVAIKHDHKLTMHRK